MSKQIRFLLPLLAAGLFSQAPLLFNKQGKSLRKWTSLERIAPAHLEAVHQAREVFSKARKTIPAFSIYNDYRGVMHVHAEDADHTQGTRQQVLAAAKQAGVRVVLSTDHRGPNKDSWSGMKDEVLYIAGSEDEGNQLRWPSPDGEDLRVLSHLEEKPEKSAEGYMGMEIYNRHADAKDEPEFYDYFKAAMTKPAEWASVVDRQKKYPVEMFAAQQDYWPELLARWDKESAQGPFVGIAANDAHRNQVYKDTLFDPYEIAFRDVSTHILATDLSEVAVRLALREGRAYVSHDWLCDPTGFYFSVQNTLGVYEMGDRIPHIGTTKILAFLPLSAHWKLIHNGKQIADGHGDHVDHDVKQIGAYRLEAWLEVDGEERPWIYSNPVFLRAPQASEMSLPPSSVPSAIEVRKGIGYGPGEDGRQKLDVYTPKVKSNLLPVLFFVHGGSWRSGDRSQYPAFASRFAKEGLMVVVPSYRLAPKHPHPAQIEDVASAFAWTVKHAAEFGGDPKRITIMGHSAGGHLVSLLATDPSYLEKFGMGTANIRKVISWSGVYEINEGLENVFGTDPEVRRNAGAMAHIRPELPPFLVAYTQWDYLTLPLQARQFHAALIKAGVPSRLLYIPGENHISEVVRSVRDEDPTAIAFVKALTED